MDAGKPTISTTKQIDAAKADPERHQLLHAGRGLYLRVSKTGAKSWVYRFKQAGRQHDIGLGPTRLVGLQEARHRAAELDRQRFDGVDPMATRGRAVAAKATTFEECAKAYLDTHAAANKPAWRTLW